MTGPVIMCFGGDRLDEVCPAHNSNQLAIRQDRNALDGLLLHCFGNLVQGRVWRRSDDPVGHKIGHLHRMRFDEFLGEVVIFDKQPDPARMLPFGINFRVVKQINSLMMPITLAWSSTTGAALMPRLRKSSAIFLTVSCGLTVTTGETITSRAFIGGLQFAERKLLAEKSGIDTNQFRDWCAVQLVASSVQATRLASLTCRSVAVGG